MTRIAGRYFDGQSSRRHTAELVSTEGETGLALEMEGQRQSYVFADLRIPSRVGNTARHIRLPDGAVFETDDNDAIDALQRQFGEGRAQWVHWLESHRLAVLAAVLLGLGFGWFLVGDGVPGLARYVAFHLPASVDARLGSHVLKLMDRHLLQPTQLPAPTRARLDREFAALTSGIVAPNGFRLAYRHSKKVGPNAFALPGGTIVVTDELIKLAKNDDEVMAVLAHEVGHVVLRHSLREALQSSIMAVPMVYLTGDVSSVTAALPVVLLELGYSRNFEREADHYAYGLMSRRGIAHYHFADILARISARDHEGDESASLDFLSTHPLTRERIAPFRDDLPASHH